VHRVLSVLGYAGGGGVCLAEAHAARGGSQLTFAVLAAFLLLLLSVALFQVRELRDYLAAASATAFGVVYIGLPLSFLIPIRFKDPASGFHWIFVLFLAIWAGDIFAYFIGRTGGRHLLFPSVSPKKTGEGAIAQDCRSCSRRAAGLAHQLAVIDFAGLITIAGPWATWRNRR
jgi:phosphatidate cytidylyltransferase